MSVYNIQGNVHFGVVGEASEITALDGESGTEIANLEGRGAIAEFGVRSALKRSGLKSDSYISITAGVLPPKISLPIRDVSAASRSLLLSALAGTSGTAISSRSTTVGQQAQTFQIWIEHVGSNDLEFYAPAMALDPASQSVLMRWSRGESFHADTELVLVATATDSDTVPAAKVDTNENLAGVYFG
jgi:hypothetical protein